MRIRKLAKLSSLLNATSSSSSTPAPQAHVCLFNQSPWDVMTDFSPPSSPMLLPSPKVNVKGLSATSETPDASISVMEWEKCDDDVIGLTEESDGGDMDDEKSGGKAVVLCCKTDGKNWHCKREAMDGDTLCEHHWALLNKKNCNKRKKSAMVVEGEGGKKRVRTKKPSTAAANPYEMVYYSGFGPGYGKIRGGEANADNGNDNNLSTKSVEHEPPVKEQEPSSTKVMNEGLDYIEDDDDDDEEDGFVKRKRARKPVKARSLKSLM